MLLFDHTSTSPPLSSTTTIKLHPDCCKTHLKASLQFTSLFHLMFVHFMPVWSFLASKWRFKLKTWSKLRTCCTTPSVTAWFPIMAWEHQITGASLSSYTKIGIQIEQKAVLRRDLTVKPYKGENFLNIPTARKALLSQVTIHWDYRKSICTTSIVHITR